MGQAYEFIMVALFCAAAGIFAVQVCETRKNLSSARYTISMMGVGFLAGFMMHLTSGGFTPVAIAHLLGAAICTVALIKTLQISK